MDFEVEYWVDQETCYFSDGENVKGFMSIELILKLMSTSALFVRWRREGRELPGYTGCVKHLQDLTGKDNVNEIGGALLDALNGPNGWTIYRALVERRHLNEQRPDTGIIAKIEQ